MRWILIFITLTLVLFGVFQLYQIMTGWHYIVPANQGELIFVSTFDENSEGWIQEQSLDQTVEIVDGVMQIALSSVQGAFTSTETYFDNFDVSVETRVTVGAFDEQSADGYGIIFRLIDQSNFYAFYINNDGVYRVVHVVDNISRNLSAWLETDAINSAIGSVNNLRVIGYGDHFQFYINDELMELCIPDDADAISTFVNGDCIRGSMQTVLTNDSLSSGRLGLIVDLVSAEETGLSIDFDNVVVYGPEPIINE